MQPLRLTVDRGVPLRVLCLGAHADDIEIGCGGTVLTLQSAYPNTAFHWVVLSADAEREAEAQRGASLFLGAAARREIIVQRFRDSFFPAAWADIKEFFESLKQLSPDLIFTHSRADRHQDHRVVAELTWNTFRGHLILEYEVPKYDGDLGLPNCYVVLDESLCERKCDHLLSTFTSQRDRPWFTAETFRGLMRIRGIEAGAPGGYAEAFYAHKLVLEA